MSSLCLCLTSSRFDDALTILERYRSFIDMAEMRLDLLDPEERYKAAALPEAAGIPLILTIRLPEDGGNWGNSGESEGERTALFETLLETGGWDYIDLEGNRPMKRVVSAAGASGTRVIRSIHDFRGSLLDSPDADPAVMIRRLAEGGAIPKIAVKCTGSRQLLNLARTAASTADVSEKVLLGMDEYGMPSRILAERFGSLWTYASAAGGPDDPEPAAPGQLDPEILSELYNFSNINSSSSIFAVTGNPIAHSRSPELHNRWLKDAGMNATYIPVRSDDFAALIEACDILGIQGLSVTVPHKETALSLCDSADMTAQSIGAVNTLLRAEEGWIGRNTDADGFLESLLQGMDLGSADELKGKKALIIGAGGAAKAAVYALTHAGMNLVILNRTAEKAKCLAEETRQSWGPLSEESMNLLGGDIDLAVQTTTVGMHPDSGKDPIPWWNPRGCTLVYDMIYEPEETVLLARAGAAGVKTLNGSGMLEAQARIQFELFTGKKVPDPRAS